MPQAGRVGDRAITSSSSGGDDDEAETGSVGNTPATQGSADVFINGRPALRVGDPGTSSSDSWQARNGSSGVFANGKRVHRLGDATDHTSGDGTLVEGSPNVFIGDMGPGGPKTVPHDRSITLEVKDAIGRTIQQAIARATCPHKTYEDVTFTGTTTISGLCSGASVSIVKGLQKGEWDRGTSSGHVLSPSHAIVEK